MRQLYILLLVVTGVGLCGYGYLSEITDGDLRWAAIMDRGQKLDQAWAKQKHFEQDMNLVFCDIVHDKLPLALAIERIEKTALTHNPIYARNLCLSKKGKSLKVQIGYNILYHFETCQDQPSPEILKLIDRLKQEMRQVCASLNEDFAL